MIVEVIDVLESSEDLQEDFKILERLVYEIKVHRNIVKILYANKINKQISKDLEEQYVEQYIITEEKLVLNIFLIKNINSVHGLLILYRKKLLLKMEMNYINEI